MATIANNAAAPATGSKIGQFFRGITVGLNAYMERHARLDRINKLNRKSDAELAEMGLKREDIPAYVFRDLFYI